MGSRDIVERLVGAASAAASDVRDTLVRDALTQTALRLQEPLQIAVAGRMKAGKSTLVNALIGRQIAPTAATECTKVVARYVHADAEGVLVSPVDGPAYSVPPTVGGGAPDDLGRPAAEIELVTVSMTSGARRGYALVDTPGLDSATTGVSATTERSLLGDPASARAVSKVDALLYLMPHPGESDVNFVKEFAAVFEGTRLGAVNILGVLSKIDQLDGAGRSDPWVEARRLAARKSQELVGCLDHVIPVSGLLAEAAAAGGYRERHTPWIRSLASADDAKLSRSLRRAERFYAADDIGLDESARRELTRTLGLWGIAQAVAAFRTGTTTTVGLVAQLRRLSNIDQLIECVNGPLADGAALVRTAAGLDELDRIAYRPGSPHDRDAISTLQAELSAIRALPELHRITEVQTLRRFDPDRSRLSAEQRADVIRVLRESDARARLAVDAATPSAEVREIARDKAAEWRSVENGPRTRRSDQAVAAVLRRSFEMLASSDEGHRG
jgi:hypothetical protein